MIHIIGIFISTAAAVVLLSSYVTIQVDGSPIRCYEDGYCPLWLTCVSNQCIDTCPKENKMNKICIMENHKPKFTCKPEYEKPKNSMDDICLPKEWSCHADINDPNKIIKCNSPKWFCVRSYTHIVCGVKQ